MAYRDEVMADVPLAYWRLGEPSGTTAEEENNVYDGTYTGGPTLGVASALIDGNTAASFATDDYVDATTLGTFGPDSLTSTTELWIKTTTAGNQYVLGTIRDGTDQLMQLGLNFDNTGSASAGKTSLQRRAGADIAGGEISTSIYDGNWHHLVWVINGSGNPFTCWVDGVSRTVTMSANPTSTVSGNMQYPMVLGARNVRSSIQDFMTASLDEVAFYTTALSEARIQAHYTAATSVAAPDVAITEAMGPSLYGPGAEDRGLDLF